MANNDSRPLPAPHAFITVSAEEFPWGIYVAYVGPSLDALAAVGCITADMRRQFDQRSNGKERKDEYGDEYHRCKKPRKDQPHRVRLVRHIHDTDRARTLPGVAECLDEAKARKEAEAQRPPCSLDYNQMQQRNRPVGRFQRIVKWVEVERKLIVINWNQIRQDVLLARATQEAQ
jgi:hypothetical protein